MREREIDREKDGDRVDKIGLQQPRRSSTAATRSVLGGSGIVEGGFERSVSLATWERQIRDVGGEMGFIGVRESFALVDRVHAELEVGEVRLSERREENGENGDATRQRVGGPQTDVGAWDGALFPSRWCVG